MHKPFLCPKCEGERADMKDCAVCDGSGVLWADGDADPIIVKRHIIEEVTVERRYVYPTYPAYPTYPPFRPYIWNTVLGDSINVKQDLGDSISISSLPLQGSWSASDNALDQ